MNGAFDRDSIASMVPSVKNFLSLDGLSVANGEKTLLSAVSFSVGAGEFAVAIGPNGAGKSSLLRAIAGHPDYAVTAGRLLFGGEEISRLAPEERARRGIFLAFQDPTELPAITIAQLLKAARQARLGAEENFDLLGFYDELHRALDSLSLDRAWANRPVNGGFSGGEKKRCELLQIMLLKPSFLLLDEIDSGLDVDGTRLVGAVLRNQLAGGVGILLVTHSKKLLDLLPVRKVHAINCGRLVRSGGIELVDAVERGGFGEVFNS
ncbi:MAG: Fe-S cluster assembly ATPase SufC [Puniceicoccales bacterium]|jgi:Fe-S cluster assembly ATP-binding protein|nr:Fe-S cluster assembly ATPase SufC [Puniceicoccales bacterium]